MYEDHQGHRRDMMVIYNLFASYTVPWSEEKRASSVLNYDLEKALSCGLVKSHLEYHSQVRASQLHKEGSR